MSDTTKWAPQKRKTKYRAVVARRECYECGKHTQTTIAEKAGGVEVWTCHDCGLVRRFRVT